MFNEYPHTDLHELNLDWVIKKVKELAAAWAQVQQDWTDEQAAFANLQSWIENYFNNLDVQTEINVKLDSMVAAGTMSELIAPYVSSGLPAEVADQIGDVVAAQIGPVVAAQISAVVADQLPAVAAAAAAQEVSAWLAIHVDPETGYVIDDSLTIQGAAADAKATGDAIGELKRALNNVESYFPVGFNLYDGAKNAGMVWKTNTYGMVELEWHWCTNLIPVDPSKGTRVRVKSSVKPYKLLAYDSDLVPHIGSTSSLYAIDIADRIYVSVSFDDEVDSEDVMIAYTNETSGASTDKWDELFPGIGYVPYHHVLDEEKVRVISCETNKTEIDALRYEMAYTTEQFLMDVGNVSGATIVTDDDGLPMAYFQGGASTLSWMAKYIKCQGYQVALVELTGKSNHIEYDSSNGAFVVIEFYDKNDVILGSKYNGCILTETRCGYHRYGAVAPKGTVKASIRIVTRASTDLWIKSIDFRVLQSYPIQQGNRFHGHLGMTLVAPKNTLPAFEMSKAAGFNTVVTNVKATQDNVLVALHDQTIDATSDGTGNVADYTYNELLEYDFGSWFNSYYTGTKIPTIESVFAFFRASGIRPGLSLHTEFTNDSHIATLCGLLKKYGFEKNCLVKSFSLPILDKMHSILGDGGNLEYFYDKSTLTDSQIDDVISDHPYVTGVEIATNGVNQNIVSYAKTNGLEVSSYLGNDMSQVKEFINMGVTRFCTDTFSDIVIPMD